MTQHNGGGTNINKGRWSCGGCHSIGHMPSISEIITCSQDTLPTYAAKYFLGEAKTCHIVVNAVLNAECRLVRIKTISSSPPSTRLGQEGWFTRCVGDAHQRPNLAREGTALRDSRHRGKSAKGRSTSALSVRVMACLRRLAGRTQSEL